MTSLKILIVLAGFLAFATGAQASEVTGSLGAATVSGSAGDTVETPAPEPSDEGSSRGRSGGSSSKRKAATASPAGEVLGASAYHFPADLSLGASGDAVSQLQKLLIDGGFLAIAAPTGYFGPMTEEAVKKFQAAHGVSPTGYVGPLTRAKLDAKATQTAPIATAELIASLLRQVEELKAKLAALKAASA